MSIVKSSTVQFVFEVLHIFFIFITLVSHSSSQSLAIQAKLALSLFYKSKSNCLQTLCKQSCYGAQSSYYNWDDLKIIVWVCSAE